MSTDGQDASLTNENTPSSLWSNNAVAIVDAREHEAVKLPALLRLLADGCLTTA